MALGWHWDTKWVVAWLRPQSLGSGGIRIWAQACDYRTYALKPCAMKSFVLSKFGNRVCFHLCENDWTLPPFPFDSVSEKIFSLQWCSWLSWDYLKSFPSSYSVWLWASPFTSVFIYQIRGGNRLIASTKILWFFFTRYCLLCAGNKCF